MRILPQITSLYKHFVGTANEASIKQFAGKSSGMGNDFMFHLTIKCKNLLVVTVTNKSSSQKC